MISCQKCTAPNTETRKFCRECGSLIVVYCSQCGFSNTITDKFCGGCGINMAGMAMPSRQPANSDELQQPEGKYSKDDLSELFHKKPSGAVKTDGEKGRKPNDSVSQDLLDSIFDSTDTD